MNPETPVLCGLGVMSGDPEEIEQRLDCDEAHLAAQQRTFVPPQQLFFFTRDHYLCDGGICLCALINFRQ